MDFKGSWWSHYNCYSATVLNINNNMNGFTVSHIVYWMSHHSTRQSAVAAGTQLSTSSSSSSLDQSLKYAPGHRRTTGLITPQTPGVTQDSVWTSLALPPFDAWGSMVCYAVIRMEAAYHVRVFAIANPSAVVCNVRAPYSRGWNFRKYFSAVLYLSHPLTSVENFTEILPWEPLRRGR